MCMCVCAFACCKSLPRGLNAPESERIFPETNCNLLAPTYYISLYRYVHVD